MAPRTTPCWTPDFTLCTSGPCCPDPGVAENIAIRDIASDLAAQIIWSLSGRQFGCCPITVRPCKPERGCGEMSLTDVIYWEQRTLPGGANMGVLSYFPTLLDGAVHNVACGCVQGCCTCRSDCEVLLPGPVCAISDVTVNGVVVPPENYTVYDHEKLVFLAGQACPPCQDYNQPLGELNTWSVTYTIGKAWPPGVEALIGYYACELAKAFLGQECALPKTVVSVARRGVDMAFADPFALAREGLTGLPLVDLWIKSVNPNRLSGRTQVWSPDMDVVRRETP